MKIPICWLKEYVDFDDSVEGLADALTFSGTEVEAITTVGSDYDGMVVGEVKEVARHPNADRLTVCQVFDGAEVQQVVCGAPNVNTGGKYAFAPVGSILADGTKLKKAKLRGVESHGMLCAEDELGLSEDHNGLLNLSDDCVPGTPLTDVLGAPEIVLELEVTSNRPDCLSVIGIAREVAAYYGVQLKRPEIYVNEDAVSVTELVQIDLQEPDLCPRYTARVLSDLTIQPSPDWMQKRLRLAGVRPINNIVDITNYVLLECGQPLHAFDYSLLTDNRVIIRRAKACERITTLDGMEHELTEDMLVIADKDRAVALAGVMGGMGSEVCDETTKVLLESACFDAENVRLTSKAVRISSESSYRFERGVDIGGVDWGSRRAAALMVELAGAKVAAGVIDAYPEPLSAQEVTCRRSKLEALLGIETSAAEMIRRFSSIGLEVSYSDDDSCTVIVPTFRRDVTREVDLIEEFARLYGLDNISPRSPHSIIIPDADDVFNLAESECRASLVGLGLYEIINYSLVSPELLDHFGEDSDKRIVMPHPISKDQSVLRTSLIPQMVNTLGGNHAHQIKKAAFFEIGRVFTQLAEGIEEEQRVALGLMGAVNRNSIDCRQPVTEAEAFLWMKGVIQSLFKALSIENWSVEIFAEKFLKEGYSVAVEIADQRIGFMGIVEEAVRKHWRITEPIAVAELKLAPLLAHVFETKALATPAAFPPIERDVAIVAGAGVSHEDILRVIRDAAPEELEEITLFDIYEGKELKPGERSLAYSLIYRSSTKTLTDEDANNYHEAVKQCLRSKLDIEIR